MAGAYLGVGEADVVINVGVSGPGVVKKAIDRAVENDPNLDLGQLSEIIKKTAYKVTRVGELIGREVAETLKAKIDSYMLARMRIFAEDHPYGAEVIRAMSDVDYEFKIGDALIKEKGVLLTLTDKEAVAEYGDPPQPLLAAGWGILTHRCRACPRPGIPRREG